MSDIDVRLSDHAITRYHERVKPTLLRHEAKADLERMARLGRVTTERPVFAGGQAAVYLLIGEDIALPLVRAGRGFVAVSCMCRAGLGEVTRRRLNRRKRQRRVDARYRRSGRSRAVA